MQQVVRVQDLARVNEREGKERGGCHLKVSCCCGLLVTVILAHCLVQLLNEGRAPHLAPFYLFGGGRASETLNSSAKSTDLLSEPVQCSGHGSLYPA